MTREEADNLFALIKEIVEKQNEARETMKKLVATIEYGVCKSDAGQGVAVSQYVWLQRRAEALYSTGLGPKPYRPMRWVRKEQEGVQ